ncbi:MAG: DUF6735 family protein [Haloarculaceae archaeon]
MGHRARVAYERPDGRYDCHRSQWGADRLRLIEEVTPATPYGQPVDDPPVDPVPTRTVASPSALAADLEYLCVEAVYVVSRSFAVRAYLSLWCGFAAVDDPDPTAGLLVGVDGVRDAAHVQRWFRPRKTTLARRVERGEIDERAATQRLEERIRRFAVDRHLLGGSAGESL